MANLVSSTLTGNLTVTANVSAANFSGNGAGLTGVDPFASGTKMVFYQASAPTGWTQDTAAALSDAAFRVTTGSGAGTGGSDTFQTTFAASRNTEQKDLPVSGSTTGTVGSTTLSTPTIASHSHGVTVYSQDPGGTAADRINRVQRSQSSFTSPGTNSEGGGGGHSHPFSGSLSSASAPNAQFAMPGMNIKYANVIVATKD
jgi:hypothetical protein